MNGAKTLTGWYPVMRASALRGQSVKRVLSGVPLNVSRGGRGHLEVAERDTGASRAAMESAGWIFVAHGDPPRDDLRGAPLIPYRSRELYLEGHVRAGLGDVGENILDTTHTSVVHEDYLRKSGSRRNVEAAVDAGEGWVSATYPPGAAPSGWGARLLGAHRYTIRDTFRAPAIAEVAYTEQARPVFAARFDLTPVTAQETYVAATISVPGTGMVAALMLSALRIFFLRIFAEDRAILEMIEANRAAHGAAPLIFTPQDLLRPGIEAILEGRKPLTTAPRIALKV